MSRQEVAQQAPAPGLNLEHFPAAALTTETILTRAHSANYDAGYFSSSMKGRFDLSSPRGTCYAADDIVTAIRESFGVATVGGFVPAEDASRMRVTLFKGVQGSFAAVSTPEAANFGVTGELPNMVPYGVPQAWAAAFDEAGYDGIRYASRFSPGLPAAWAIFGESGARQVGDVLQVLDGPDACAQAGLTVLPLRPKASELTKLSPPEADHDQ